MLVAVVVSLPQAARATGEAVEATYRWISTTDLNDGTFAASLDFNVTNTGTVDFFDLRVRLLTSPPVFPPDPNAVLAIGSLAVGETATLTQSINFHVPVDSEIGIRFVGRAQEADGLGDPTMVVIEQETEQ
jgi:hypothetical protein